MNNNNNDIPNNGNDNNDNRHQYYNFCYHNNPNYLRLIILFFILIIGGSIFVTMQVAAQSEESSSSPVLNNEFYKNFKYDTALAYDTANLDVSKLDAEKIAANYPLAKKILSRVTKSQALIIADKSPDSDLRDFGSENAKEIIKSKIPNSNINNLQMPIGDDRFFITGNQLNYGAVKTPVPTGFSGAIAFDNDKRTFMLMPDKKVSMPALKNGESAAIIAKGGAEVNFDGIIISTTVTIGVDNKGKQTIVSDDASIKIIKDNGKYTITQNTQITGSDGKTKVQVKIYETNAKITIKNEKSSDTLYLSPAKNNQFYVSQNNVHANFETKATFLLGQGFDKNQITFGSASDNEIIVSAQEKVICNLNFAGNSGKKVSDIVLGNRGQASVKIAFIEDSNTVTSKLTHVSGEVRISGFTITGDGKLFAPSNLKGTALLSDGLPDEMIIDANKPDEVWKKKVSANGITTSISYINGNSDLSSPETVSTTLENIGTDGLDELAKDPKNKGRGGLAVPNNNPLNIKGRADKLTDEIKARYGIIGLDSQKHIMFSDPAGGLAYGVDYLQKMFSADNPNYKTSMTLNEAFDMYVAGPGTGSLHVQRILALNIPGITKNTKLADIPNDQVYKIIPAISSVESGVYHDYLESKGAFNDDKLRSIRNYVSSSSSSFSSYASQVKTDTPASTIISSKLPNANSVRTNKVRKSTK